mmetsp:Transcript_56339/g.123425  ORF Transcript_56339/g.123425 Transcript_56339/m.123425 type:complete len:215 (-) Transcript_56339:105-749(-)
MRTPRPRTRTAGRLRRERKCGTQSRSWRQSSRMTRSRTRPCMPQTKSTSNVRMRRWTTAPRLPWMLSKPTAMSSSAALTSGSTASLSPPSPRSRPIIARRTWPRISARTRRARGSGQPRRACVLWLSWVWRCVGAVRSLKGTARGCWPMLLLSERKQGTSGGKPTVGATGARGSRCDNPGGTRPGFPDGSSSGPVAKARPRWSRWPAAIRQGTD